MHRFSKLAVNLWLEDLEKLEIGAVGESHGYGETTGKARGVGVERLSRLVVSCQNIYDFPSQILDLGKLALLYLWGHFLKNAGMPHR